MQFSLFLNLNLIIQSTGFRMRFRLSTSVLLWCLSFEPVSSQGSNYFLHLKGGGGSWYDRHQNKFYGVFLKRRVTSTGRYLSKNTIKPILMINHIRTLPCPLKLKSPPKYLYLKHSVSLFISYYPFSGLVFFHQFLSFLTHLTTWRHHWSKFVLPLLI